MTTVTKTLVEATWNTKKLHEITTKMWANNFLATMSVLAKHGGPEAIKEFQNEVRARKIDYYKQLGVKTPIDLAKAQAELETNVFGSKIEVAGDEKRAQVIYKTCNFFNAIKAEGKLSAKDQEKMGENFSSCVQDLAKDFGFKGEVEFENDIAIITYSK